MRRDRLLYFLVGVALAGPVGGLAVYVLVRGRDLYDLYREVIEQREVHVWD